MDAKSAAGRLIIALDVPTHEEALAAVETLDNVSFYKVGLQLFLAGDLLGLIRKLRAQRGGGIFVDLKLSGDIGNTITSFVEGCRELDVKFITLTESVPYATTLRTIEAARAARGAANNPRLLMVPLLSSLGADDLRGEEESDATRHILTRGKKLLGDGCDGLIVSGEAIAACREAFPEADIVSPGIRPAWAGADDHKRHATPADAIRMGADYLVVGRPILKDPDPRAAAQRIIEEMAEAFGRKTARP